MAEFHTHSNHADGHTTRCKVCRRLEAKLRYHKNRLNPEFIEKCRENNRRSYRANGEKAKARANRWKAENPERYAIARRKHYAENIVEKRAYSRAWFQKNLEKERQRCRLISIRTRKPTGIFEKARESIGPYTAVRRWHSGNNRTKYGPQRPSWIKAESFREHYEIATALEMQTGRSHHIDHIYPLIHSKFSGLDVPWNLRVIPEAMNRFKKNKSPEEIGLLIPKATGHYNKEMLYAAAH